MGGFLTPEELTEQFHREVAETIQANERHTGWTISHKITGESYHVPKPDLTALKANYYAQYPERRPQ